MTNEQSKADIPAGCVAFQWPFDEARFEVVTRDGRLKTGITALGRDGSVKDTKGDAYTADGTYGWFDDSMRHNDLFLRPLPQPRTYTREECVVPEDFEVFVSGDESGAVWDGEATADTVLALQQKGYLSPAGIAAFFPELETGKLLQIKLSAQGGEMLGTAAERTAAIDAAFALGKEAAQK